MAAVTADQYSSTRVHNNIDLETHAIATSATVYVGTLANFNTGGRVVTATAAASRRFAGEVVEIINDSGNNITAATGNTAGTVKARIRHGHQMLLNVLTAARTFTNLGKSVYVGDNVSVTDATGAGTAGVRVIVGQLTELVDSKTRAWVKLRVVGDTGAT
jgi:hypothetical protein